jgi:hypothetical protein
VTARLPIYEGDGLLRRAPAASADRIGDPSESLEASREQIMEVERMARRMRADVIAGLFARAFAWFDGAFWRAQQRDVEHYLAQASDAADLERRMRSLERVRAGALGSYR